MTPAVLARAIRVGAAGDPSRPVVRDVGFVVPPGGALGIVGESGSGKTALIQALFGYARPGLAAIGGEVIIGASGPLPVSRPAAFANIRGRVIAMIPQSPAALLDPIMTIGRQLREVATNHRAVLESLADVGFADPARMMRRYPHQLSGGQRQRVAISLALLLSPDVLVLDEATTDLDAVTQRMILDLLLQLRVRRGFAIVSVSHDLRVLGALCDDLLVLHGGEVMETGPLAALMTQPRHPYTARLVGRFRAGPLAAGWLPAPIGRTGEAACSYLGHCPMATERCQQAPPLRPLDATRASRCWFAERVIPAASAEAAPHRVQPAATPILTITDLHAAHREPGLLSRRRIPALQGVTLTVARGECLAVVGESGSGKSTLARVIMGLHLPAHGTLRFDGSDLAPRAALRPLAVRKDLQIVFQNPEAAFNPRVAVGEVLRRRLRLFEGTSGKEMPARLAGLVAETGLPPDCLDRRPAALSGGEKQRLAIARALIGEPKLLICDEIVSALDVETQARIIQLLARLQRDRALSMIFISHDFSVVAAIADRVAVLQSGGVVETGSTHAILDGGSHDYTRLLIAAAFARPRHDPDPARIRQPEISNAP